MKKDKGYLRVIRMVPERAEVDIADLPANALERIKADTENVYDDDIWELLGPSFDQFGGDHEIDYIEIGTPEGEYIPLWDAHKPVSAPIGHPSLIEATKCALADLEGIMPAIEPSGDRHHPGWKTIDELKTAINKPSPAPIALTAEQWKLIYKGLELMRDGRCFKGNALDVEQIDNVMQLICLDGIEAAEKGVKAI